MQKNYIYALIYVINGKIIIKKVSPNYAYINRCKVMYDESLHTKGAIKKMHKDRGQSHD